MAFESVTNELNYRLRRFDRLNAKVPCSQTAELVGATLLSAGALEQFSQGNIINGLLELAGAAALAGASRKDVRVQKKDYDFEHTRLK